MGNINLLFGHKEKINNLIFLLGHLDRRDSSYGCRILHRFMKMSVLCILTVSYIFQRPQIQ